MGEKIPGRGHFHTACFHSHSSADQSGSSYFQYIFVVLKGQSAYSGFACCIIINQCSLVTAQIPKLSVPTPPHLSSVQFV